MGNNPSRPDLDPRARIPSDRAYRDHTRGYTTRGKKSKYGDFYEDDEVGEDYLPQVPYAPAGYPQMTYGLPPYLSTFTPFPIVFVS